MSIFGVDSLELSTKTVSSGKTLYDWVVSKAGQAPAFWGRYIYSTSGVLTSTEASYLHGKGCKILPLIRSMSNINNKSATLAQGNADGQKAVNAAKGLSIPTSTALYVDVEESYTPSSAWIQGFCDTLWANNYAPGFYCNPQSTNFTTPFSAACAADPSHVGLGSCLIWSSVPEPGPEGPASKMPTWNPATPPGFAKSNICFWQYIEDVFLAPDGVSRVDLDEARDTAAMIDIW